MARRRRRRPLHERSGAEAAATGLKVDGEIALHGAARIFAVNPRSHNRIAGISADVEQLEPEGRVALGELEMIVATDVDAPLCWNVDRIVGRRGGPRAVDHGRVELK